VKNCEVAAQITALSISLLKWKQKHPRYGILSKLESKCHRCADVKKKFCWTQQDEVEILCEAAMGRYNQPPTNKGPNLIGAIPSALQRTSCHFIRKAFQMISVEEWPKISKVSTKVYQHYVLYLVWVLHISCELTFGQLKRWRPACGQ
jgi:hypothetical protein